MGKKIRDAVFYMNRLGFMSDEAMIMSQAGDYFNFFQGSSISISDADPIDLSVSTTRPAKLKSAIATPGGLLMFAENSQFIMRSQDSTFGPSTARIDEIGAYAYRSNVHPVKTSVSVLFASEAQTFSKVFEMATEVDQQAQVSENTRIVPSYIPPGLTWLTSVPNSSLVLMGNDTDTVWTFKYYNSGNERQMAGWSKWQFADDIHMMEFDHDTGFVVALLDDGKHVLSRMELLDDPETAPIQAFDRKFTARLDNYIYEEDITVSYDGSDTTITLPAGAYTADRPYFLLTTTEGVETFYERVEVENDAVVIEGRDLRDTGFVVGMGYNMDIELPSFFIKEGERNTADRRYPPMVFNLYLELYLSGRYLLTVEKVGYATRVIDLDMPRADLYMPNTPAIELHSTRTVPVYCRGDLVKVTVNVPDPLPASLTSYSWEGSYNTRGIARR